MLLRDVTLERQGSCESWIKPARKKEVREVARGRKGQGDEPLWADLVTEGWRLPQFCQRMELQWEEP